MIFTNVGNYLTLRVCMKKHKISDYKTMLFYNFINKYIKLKLINLITSGSLCWLIGFITSLRIIYQLFSHLSLNKYLRLKTAKHPERYI